MAFPFETVTFIYFDEKSGKDGTKKEKAKYQVKVLWNGSLTWTERNDRYFETKVDAEIKVFFNKQIPFPNPKIVMVERNGERFKVVNTPDDIKARLSYYILGVVKSNRMSP